MITIEQLTKVYGQKRVLDILELVIPRGQTFGLVGNNGAGKTTLFSLILDLIQATTGGGKIDGEIVSLSEGWKKRTASFMDENFLIGYLTPEEYFYFIGELRGLNKASVDEFLRQFADFFNGEVFNSKKYIRDLSKGNQKKTGLVGALIGMPEIVLFDEPFANLDPSSQIKLKMLIKHLSKNSQNTFLISSHDLAHTSEICDRIVVLEKGLIVKDITASGNTLNELEQFFAGIKQ